jgi:hypothetical protein
MSPSFESGLRTLIADSGVPACEVIVLDGNFAPVGRGVGKVEVKLRPGLYKVRYKIGRAVTDSNVIELEPGSEPYVVPIPQLTVRTARPTRAGRTTGSADPDIASRLSRHVDKHVGSGAELFLFVREDSDLPAHLATGLAIFDLQGGLVADLADAHGENTCAGCTLALNPGSYLLRLNQSDGPPLEQCIHMSEGWQTQVFLESLRTDLEAPPEIDLSDAAILMSPLGSGFNPDDGALLWADSARHALASSRNSAPVARMNHVRNRFQELQKARMPSAELALKFQHEFPNPMHGIYSAHLLRQMPNYDAALLHDVIEILRLQVGDHPDVIALRLTDPNASVQFRTPPMLRSSWQLIVTSTTTRHDVVPTESYAAAIGNRLWGGGAWLVWRMPDPEVLAASDAPQEAPWDILLAYVQHQLETKSPDEFLASVGSQQRLTGMELTVLTYMARLMGQLNAARAFTANADYRTWYGSVLQTARKIAPETFVSDVQRVTQSAIAKTLNAGGLVMETGLPYFTVNEAVRKLVEKLNIRADPNVRARVAAGMSSFASTVTSAAADVSFRVKHWHK